MNVRYEPEIGPGMALPIEAFLAWVEQQEGKYEYDRGTIGMMVRVTRDHAVLVTRFVLALSARLDPANFDVVAEAFAVHTGSSVRFPDVLLERAGGDRKALRSAEPLVIVEVLSPSSKHLDEEVKRDEYLALESLQAYIVASQDAPRLSVWVRNEDGRFLPAPTILEGPDKTLRIPSLGLEIRLSELYSVRR